MVSFIVPVGGGGPELWFSVGQLGVLFEGSRHGEVPQDVCQALVGGLARDGFSFRVVCSSSSKSTDHYRVIGSCLYGVEG